MIKRYKLRPADVLAVKWDGRNTSEVLSFATPGVIDPALSCLIVHTKEGGKTAKPGDYIVKTDNGDYYPQSAKDFEAKYIIQ